MSGVTMKRRHHRLRAAERATRCAAERVAASLRSPTAALAKLTAGVELITSQERDP